MGVIPCREVVLISLNYPLYEFFRYDQLYSKKSYRTTSQLYMCRNHPLRPYNEVRIVS